MRKRVVIHNYLPGRDSGGAFFSGSARRRGDQLEHPMTVPREEEERHRDRMYRDTGITRVAHDVGIGDLVELRSPIQGYKYAQVKGWNISGGTMYRGLPTGKAASTILKLKQTILYTGDYGPEVTVPNNSFRVIGEVERGRMAAEWLRSQPRDAEPKKGDPNYERWAQQRREEQNRGGGGFHNDAVKLDVTKPLKEDGKWWFTSRKFTAEGKEVRKTHGPYKTEAEAGSARSQLLSSSRDADDLQRYSGDVIWITVSESDYNKLRDGGPAGKIDGREATVIEKDIVTSQFSGKQHRVKVRLR